MVDKLEKFVFIAVPVLLVLLLFNLFTTTVLVADVEDKLTELQEAARPPQLELVGIRADCDGCFDIDAVITGLRNDDINLTDESSLDASSQEARTLIEKYSIEKLPTVILKGEIDKIPIQNFVKINDALVFNGIVPPYIDVETMKIMGKVSAIIIKDNDCEVCSDFGAVVQSLQQNNVVFSDIKEVDFPSSEAEDLIEKYGISKLPSLLLSEDINAYPAILQSLRQAGSQLKNGYYVIESNAPYVEADTGDIRGLVTMTMLTDESCEECYDVTIHRQIMSRFGLAIDEEIITDISSPEGKDLLEKYSVVNVPTIILTGDVSLYESLVAVWQQVGTVDDGAYVFREINRLGGVVYKDLSTGETIVPRQQTSG